MGEKTFHCVPSKCLLSVPNNNNYNNTNENWFLNNFVKITNIIWEPVQWLGWIMLNFSSTTSLFWEDSTLKALYYKHATELMNSSESRLDDNVVFFLSPLLTFIYNMYNSICIICLIWEQKTGLHGYTCVTSVLYVYVQLQIHRTSLVNICNLPTIITAAPPNQHCWTWHNNTKRHRTTWQYNYNRENTHLQAKEMYISN